MTAWILSNASIMTWNSVFASTTGQYMAAAAIQGTAGPLGIYTSDNFGQTWNNTLNHYTNIIGNINGSFLVAYDGTYKAGVATSNNFGGSWTTSVNAPNMVALAADSTGQYIVGCSQANSYPYVGLHRSVDHGLTFAPLSASPTCEKVSSSYDGKYLITINSEAISTSNNFGTTWVDAEYDNDDIAGIAFLEDVAISGSGQIQAVVSSESVSPGLLMSSNYGVKWSFVNSVCDKYSSICGWSAVSMDSTGNNIALVSSDYNYGTIVISADRGSSWKTYSSIKHLQYGALGVSGNGQFLVGPCIQNGIYTGSGMFKKDNNKDDIESAFRLSAGAISGIVISVLIFGCALGVCYRMLNKRIHWNSGYTRAAGSVAEEQMMVSVCENLINSDSPNVLEV